MAHFTTVSTTKLSDFIASVVADSRIEPGHENGHFPRIVVFCHAHFLQGFSFSTDNLSVSQINSLHHVELISTANHKVIQSQLRQFWLDPSGVDSTHGGKRHGGQRHGDTRHGDHQRFSGNTILAFYDLLTEGGPLSAWEHASSVNSVLYMVARACMGKTPPRAVFLNIPPGKSSHHSGGGFSSCSTQPDSRSVDDEQDAFYVSTDVLHLVSKWTNTQGA